MTSDELEEYFRDTAIVYGTLNMVRKQDDGSEKLLYVGLMETWYFTSDDMYEYKPRPYEWPARPRAT